MQSSKDLYARLELLSPAAAQPAAPTAASPSRWQRWGKALLRYFLGSKEPHIVTKLNDMGHPVYEVYDPVDRRRHTFSTEHEVRVWLEERYYQ